MADNAEPEGTVGKVFADGALADVAGAGAGAVGMIGDDVVIGSLL